MDQRNQLKVDQQGIVECGKHRGIEASYVDISEICERNQRLLCKECFFAGGHQNKSDQTKLFLLKDTSGKQRTHETVKIAEIEEQLERLRGLQKLQLQSMNELEKFYEETRQEFNREIDISLKRMRMLFDVELEQEKIFEIELLDLAKKLENIIGSCNQRYSSLNCKDIEQTMNQIYSDTRELSEQIERHVFSDDLWNTLFSVGSMRESKNDLLERFYSAISFTNVYSERKKYYQQMAMNSHAMQNEGSRIDSIIYEQFTKTIFGFNSRNLEEDLAMQLNNIDQWRRSIIGKSRETQQALKTQEQYEECDIILVQAPQRGVQLQPLSESFTNFSADSLYLFSSSALIKSLTYNFTFLCQGSLPTAIVIGVVDDARKTNHDAMTASHSHTFELQNEDLSGNLKSRKCSISDLFQDKKSNSLEDSNPKIDIQKIFLSVTMNLSSQIFAYQHGHNPVESINLQGLNSQTQYRLAVFIPSCPSQFPESISQPFSSNRSSYQFSLVRVTTALNNNCNI